MLLTRCRESKNAIGLLTQDPYRAGFVQIADHPGPKAETLWYNREVALPSDPTLADQPAITLLCMAVLTACSCRPKAVGIS
jgi:hypothetical protein